jgi:hypothetical protein
VKRTIPDPTLGLAVSDKGDRRRNFLETRGLAARFGVEYSQVRHKPLVTPR